MPRPTRGDVHVDRLLTNLSVGWMQKAEGFAADQVFPVVPVQQQSNRYAVYDRADFYRSQMGVRAPGSESVGAGYRIDNTPTYFAEIRALHKDIDDPTRANYDDPFQPDRDAGMFLSGQAMISKDKQWVSKYFTTSVWTGGTGGATDQAGGAAAATNVFIYFSSAGSSPFQTIRKQAISILKNTGYLPNTLVVGIEVWAALADHPDLLDRIKYTQKGIVTPDLIAAALELDKVVICSGIENTAAETNAASPQTMTGAFIAGKHMLLCYSAPSPGLMQPSAGYTFSWTGLVGANALGGRIKNFRMEELESDRVEIEMAYDQKVVAADMGCFFNGAVQ